MPPKPLAAPAASVEQAAQQILDWSVQNLSDSCRLSPNQADQLVLLAELLDRWNQVHSLTRILGLDDMLHRHVLDSLVALPGLWRRLEGGPSEPLLVDVGSGNGFPGLALAIGLPGSRWQLVERVARKAAFLRHAAGRLGLSDRVLVVEKDVQRHHLDGRAHVVLSRAFADLERFIEWTDHLLQPSGWMVYWAGRLAEVSGLQERRYHPTTAVGQNYSLDALDSWPDRAADERHLLWLQRNSNV